MNNKMRYNMSTISGKISIKLKKKNIKQWSSNKAYQNRSKLLFKEIVLLTAGRKNDVPRDKKLRKIDINLDYSLSTPKSG